MTKPTNYNQTFLRLKERKPPTTNYDLVMVRVSETVAAELDDYPVLYEELKQKANRESLMVDLEGIVGKDPECCSLVPDGDFKNMIKAVMLSRATLLMNESERQYAEKKEEKLTSKPFRWDDDSDLVCVACGSPVEHMQIRGTYKTSIESADVCDKGRGEFFDCPGWELLETRLVCECRYKVPEEAYVFGWDEEWGLLIKEEYISSEAESAEENKLSEALSEFSDFQARMRGESKERKKR